MRGRGGGRNDGRGSGKIGRRDGKEEGRWEAKGGREEGTSNAVLLHTQIRPFFPSAPKNKRLGFQNDPIKGETTGGGGGLSTRRERVSQKVKSHPPANIMVDESLAYLPPFHVAHHRDRHASHGPVLDGLVKVVGAGHEGIHPLRRQRA